MRSVYFLSPGEGWIVDRFGKEWNEHNLDMSITNPYGADVIWLNGSWCWQRLPYNLLSSKKVITTIHHIVPEKFDSKAKHDFVERDAITTCYHVYNQRVFDFVRPLTQKPLHFIPYWANQDIFVRSVLSKERLRDKHGLPLDAFIVASFQRDTEGDSIESKRFNPKLEKGPDLFCNAVEKLKNTTCPNIHVLLSAWRRQYVIGRLLEAKISYSYFEMPKHDDLNELYQALDMYIVTSRCEGGPQSLIECGLLEVPVVSTPVGIAEQVLPQSAINDDVTQATPAIPNVEHMKIPKGFEPYRRLIQTL